MMNISRYIILVFLIFKFQAAFTQKKKNSTPNDSFNAISLFEKGEYLKIQKKYSKNILVTDTSIINQLVKKSKKAILIKRKIVLNLKKHQPSISQKYIDTLTSINSKDQNIYKYYLAIADYQIKKGNIPEIRKNLNLAKNYNASINLKSRNTHLFLQEARAKQIFINKTGDFLWLDEYATLTKKKIVKRNEERKIDSLYNNQKDSLIYKKWLPTFYIFGGIFKDKILLNSIDNQDYLTTSNYSSQVGCRIFLTPPMNKISYFTDITYSNRNFQNIAIIENTKYYIEKFSVSSISIPLNVKYNLNNSVKHFYASFGIAPSYFFRMRYENPVRKIDILDNSLFNKFQMVLKTGIGFQIESKKDRKSMFFQINGQYFPTNVLNLSNFYSNHDIFESKKFQSTIVSGELLIGVKF